MKDGGAKGEPASIESQGSTSKKSAGKKMSAAASVKGMVTGKGSGTPNNTGGGVGSSTSRRVLVLSQKGDWTACDSTLKVLEKESLEAGIRLPLATVADNVSLAFNLYTLPFL